MKSVLISLSPAPGIQRYAISICNEMSKTQKVTFICTKGYDLNKLNDKVDTYNFISTKTPRLELATFNIFELIKIVKLINLQKPDIVHFLSSHPWNILLTILLKKHTKIHTIHDPVPHPGEKVTKFVSIYNDLIMKKMRQNILLHGNTYLNKLISQGISSNRISIVPLATEEISEEEVKLSEEKKVLFFGRIKPYKGLDLFIQAMEEVFKVNKEAKAIIAGEGELDEYRKFIKETDRYEISNYSIPEDNIERFFKDSRIVVLPYKSATQSGIIPIAYFYGRPVIVTNVGSLSEVVDDKLTGCVVEKDVKQLATVINDVLSNNDRCLIMGKNAQSKLNTELSIGKMVDGFKEEYRKLLI